MTIAHRLYIVRHADHIIVKDHGEIVDWGTHEDLAKKIIITIPFKFCE
ncbi:MAG: hypothetical protein J0I53_05565 [Chryseobacterium sp.]|nr:hypothetical protein [Chryseobacterium sp.]